MWSTVEILALLQLLMMVLFGLVRGGFYLVEHRSKKPRYVTVLTYGRNTDCS
jgi:hypothetical protein